MSIWTLAAAGLLRSDVTLRRGKPLGKGMGYLGTSAMRVLAHATT